MNWLSIIGSILAVVQLVINYLHDKKMIEQGVAQELMKANQSTLDAIDSAIKAKAAVDDAAARDPSSVMRPDKYERPD